MRKKVVFFPYDFDTAIGTNNEGDLQFSYNLEDIDTFGNNVDVYNGQNSVLWKNVRAAFFEELKAMYKQLRSSKAISYDKIEEMFEAHQSKWPEAIFNEDSYYTYLQPYVDPEDGKPDASYFSMLQGSKASQRKWWLYNRFRYIDSKYNAGDALTDVITLRGYAKSNITITPYADIYASILFGSYLVSTRANRNQSYTLNCPLDNVNDTETYIYSASQLASVGDLSGYQVGYANFTNGTRLQSLKCGDSNSNYTNEVMLDLYIGNNVLLETIDCRNCVNLGGSRVVQGNTILSTTPTIEMGGCVGLKYAYFDNTSVKGVTLPNGSIIEVLHLNAPTNLTLKNCKNLTDLTVTSFANTTTLWIENCSNAINPLDILDEIPENSRVRIIGIEITASTYDEIDEFYDQLDTMRGLDESGNTVEKADGGAQVSGIIHINALTGAQVAELQERYPYITIDAAHTSSNRFYKTWDGSSIVKTVACVDGVPQEAAPSGPARTSTAQYNYTFIGWSKYTDSETADANLNEVNKADHSFYAAYSKAVRSYTITFVKASDDGGGTLETKTVAYGQTPSYTGTTPTTTKGDATDYPFEGWTPSITAVTGNATYTASFGSPVEVAEISDSWDTIIENIENGTYKNKYKIGNYKPLDFGTEGTLNMQIAAFDTDTAANGTGTVPMTMIPIEFLKTTHRMNPATSQGVEGTGAIGGWEKCEMRTYLKNTILPLIPANIRSHMISVTKTHPAYNASETQFTQTTTDNIWIPSQDEINNGTYKALYKDASSRIKKNISTNTANYWWLRSANNASYFRYVNSGGILNSNNASNTFGVVPCFCLGTYAQAHQIGDSWDTILSNIDNGTYATKYSVGDCKELDLGTEGTVNMQIAAFDTDDKADGSGKAEITWISREALKTGHRMNPNTSNDHSVEEGYGTWGGWDKCEMRTYLKNTIKSKIPTNIKNRMVYVIKVHDSIEVASGTTKVTQTTTDDIWIPSQPEMDTNGSYDVLFPTQKSRIKRNTSTKVVINWWLRSARNEFRFFDVEFSGDFQYPSVGDALGVVPCFCTTRKTSYEFSELATALDNGTYATAFKIGDTFPMDLGSEGIVNMQIAAFDTDDKADNSGKAKVTLISKEALKTTHVMNPFNNNNIEGTGTIGGWDKCEMRAYLNDTIKHLIPTAIKNRIVEATKTQGSFNVSNNTIVSQITTDDIWIPSKPEIDTGGAYVSLFQTQESRVKKNVSTNGTENWWLRSVYSAYHFHGVSYDGIWKNESANYTYGVVPCFCLD